jgi:hypothetical protein
MLRCISKYVVHLGEKDICLLCSVWSEHFTSTDRQHCTVCRLTMIQFRCVWLENILADLHLSYICPCYLHFGLLYHPYYLSGNDESETVLYSCTNIIVSREYEVVMLRALRESILILFCCYCHDVWLYVYGNLALFSNFLCLVLFGLI